MRTLTNLFFVSIAVISLQGCASTPSAQDYANQYVKERIAADPTLQVHDVNDDIQVLERREGVTSVKELGL
jgi:hypothetical protein